MSYTKHYGKEIKIQGIPDESRRYSSCVDLGKVKNAVQFLLGGRSGDIRHSICGSCQQGRGPYIEGSSGTDSDNDADSILGRLEAISMIENDKCSLV